MAKWAKFDTPESLAQQILDRLALHEAEDARNDEMDYYDGTVRAILAVCEISGLPVPAHLAYRVEN